MKGETVTEEPYLLTVTQVAERLNVSRPFVDWAARYGVLPYQCKGRCKLFLPRDVLQLADGFSAPYAEFQQWDAERKSRNRRGTKAAA